MARNPFMPVFIADYFADTRHLTTLQHGAYPRRSNKEETKKEWQQAIVNNDPEKILAAVSKYIENNDLK